MRVTSKKLRASASGQECTVRLPGICNFNPTTTVLPHLPCGQTQALRGLIVDEGGSNQALRITHVRAVISNTPGETDHVLSVPAGDVPMAANEVAVPGVMTWL